MPRRESYQDQIDRDREGLDPAAEPGKHQPPKARRGYRRRAEINRALARYYESCKSETAGRFQTQRRQKQYCSAVAWKRAEQSGRFPDYPTFRNRERSDMARRKMPQRNKRTGRFVKGSHASEPRRAREEEPRRRSTRRRSTGRRASAAAPRRRRSTGRKRQTPQTNTAIVLARESPRRRRSPSRSRGRRSSHHRAAAYSPRRYRMREAMMVGAGGVMVFTTGAAFGWLFADALDRYLAGVDPATPAATLTATPLAAPYTMDNPIPKWNNDSEAMQPNWKRMGVQLLGAIIFFGFGAMVAKSMLWKFFLYGMGSGFTVHLSTQIITAYVIVPMVKSSTGTGARMYQHEINVLQGLANPSGGVLGRGPANKPGRGLLGRGPGQENAPPPQLPANQPVARVPVALATATAASPQGTAAAPAAAGLVPAAAAAAPARMGQPPAGGHVAGCACQQCKPEEAQVPARPNGKQPFDAGAVWSALLERAA